MKKVAHALVRAASTLVSTLAALAQIAPHAGYVYPAGGRQGTEFEVTVGGQYLDGVNNAYVSGEGVQASVVKLVKPLTQGQANQLRQQMQELVKRGAPEDRKTIAEIREKLAKFIRRPASPAIVEQVTLRIAMEPNAAPGERELRLATTNGLTNPLIFCVGQLPEVSKPAAEVSEEAASVLLAARFRPPQPQTTEAPVNIKLPIIVNGQIRAGGVDRYRFPAVKGQRLVIAAAARELIPYISDAVPGWFQATVALYDSKGTEVQYADHYRFHPDPVLHYEIPDDGDYVLEIKDSIYRGREDFVYRIAMGELPFLTGIFPLGGKAGKRTAIEMQGWNLPVSKVTQDTKGKSPGVYPVSARKGEWVSNRMLFAVDMLPESVEKEPNDRIKNAQRVKLPMIVNGRIGRSGDWDVFRFEGRAGEEIVAEVMARRLDSPLDSVLKLTDASGKQLALNDDEEDKASGLLTHHADSRILFKLPAKGTYYLHLGDAQRQGGQEYAYRLRISHPQPDFDLRVVPASINPRPGATIPITVYAIRKDGFAGEIALKLKDAPPGFALSGAWVPANENKVRLTLTVPVSRIERPRPMHLEGHATIQGREVHRTGVPAEDMMQAFAYRHLVASKDWMVRVTGVSRSGPAWRVAAEKPVKVPTGGSASVRVVLPAARLNGQVRLALNEPPEGIAIQRVTPGPDGMSILLRADGGKVKPGLKGNLIVDAFLEITPKAGAGNRPATRRQPLGTLPAIPFEIVGM